MNDYTVPTSFFFRNANGGGGGGMTGGGGGGGGGGGADTTVKGRLGSTDLCPADIQTPECSLHELLCCF